MRLAIAIDRDHWDDAPAKRRLVRAAVGAAFAVLGGAPARSELSVALAGDAAVRALNARWRGKDRATNVLSFPAAPVPHLPAGAARPLGDIVLAAGVVRDEAQAQGKRLDDHLAHLVVHGVLHVMGHDHADAAGAERMEALERAALDRLGVSNPYE